MSAPTLTDTTPTSRSPTQPDAGARAGRRCARRRRRRTRRRTWRTSRFAYALVAPAVFFMVLVHLLPTAGGLVLSFKNLNTFTFSQLFGAPWAGLENYRAILFDADNPLHAGSSARSRNTAIYTSATVGGDPRRRHGDRAAREAPDARPARSSAR